MRAEAEAAHRQGVRWLLMQKFAKELAFVRRYHKIPAEHDRAALAFGGRDAVEQAIESALAREIFERGLRTEAEFRAYESEVGRTLFEKGHALTQTTVKILELNQALRAELGRGGLASQRGPGAGSKKTLGLNELSRLKEPVTPAYFEQITRDMDKLLPKDFLEAYTIDRIVLLPRYLDAMKIRLARARIDPEKDKTKAAQVEPYQYTLERLEEDIAVPTPPMPPAPPEKRQAVEELRRMVEEFKIALFAPEIRTAFPISAVRLARKIKEIEAMV
jgi:ATP-dependent helicase HrpA